MDLLDVAIWFQFDLPRNCCSSEQETQTTFFLSQKKTSAQKSNFVKYLQRHGTSKQGQIVWFYDPDHVWRSDSDWWLSAKWNTSTQTFTLCSLSRFHGFHQQARIKLNSEIFQSGTQWKTNLKMYLTSIPFINYINRSKKLVLQRNCTPCSLWMTVTITTYRKCFSPGCAPSYLLLLKVIHCCRRRGLLCVSVCESHRHGPGNEVTDIPDSLYKLCDFKSCWVEFNKLCKTSKARLKQLVPSCKIGIWHKQ